LKLLIAGNKTRFYHLEGFTNALEKNGIKCKLIYDIEYSNKFFDININAWVVISLNELELNA